MTTEAAVQVVIEKTLAEELIPQGEEIAAVAVAADSGIIAVALVVEADVITGPAVEALTAEAVPTGILKKGIDFYQLTMLHRVRLINCF